LAYFEPYFGPEEAISFWKRGSLRSGSNIGSSRSNPPRRVNSGVSGGFAARGASCGIESSFSRVEMVRSGSPNAYVYACELKLTFTTSYSSSTTFIRWEGSGSYTINNLDTDKAEIVLKMTSDPDPDGEQS
jgi:hypothetical protein